MYFELDVKRGSWWEGADWFSDGSSRAGSDNSAALAAQATADARFPRSLTFPAVTFIDSILCVE